VIDNLKRFEDEIGKEVMHQRGESCADLATEVQIIALERQKHIGGPLIPHIEVALVASCPRPHPGKPPYFKDEVRKFRLRFIGIFRSPRLQEEFRGRIKKFLLELWLEDIESLRLEDLFDNS
jgi:hypothetical protein